MEMNPLLFSASRGGLLEASKLLIENDADVFYEDKNKNTVLHKTATYNYKFNIDNIMYLRSVILGYISSEEDFSRFLEKENSNGQTAYFTKVQNGRFSRNKDVANLFKSFGSRTEGLIDNVGNYVDGTSYVKRDWSRSMPESTASKHRRRMENGYDLESGKVRERKHYIGTGAGVYVPSSSSNGTNSSPNIEMYRREIKTPHQPALNDENNESYVDRANRADREYIRKNPQLFNNKKYSNELGICDEENKWCSGSSEPAKVMRE